MSESVIVDKMNIVLEAAGINMKLFSFEQLVMGAPILFINAFEPLFEHSIQGLNPNPNNLGAHEKNCNLLVDELKRKVPPDRLQSANGRKLSAGEKETLSAIVDLYYERAEYLRTRFDDYLSAPPKVIAPRHRLLKKDSSKKNSSATNIKLDDQPQPPSSHPEVVIHNLQQYVATLEHKLESIQVEAEKKGSDKKKRRKSREREEHGSNQDEELGIREDESESIRANGDSSSHTRLRTSSSNHKPKRPTSAPSRRMVVISGGPKEDRRTAIDASGLASSSAHDKQQKEFSKQKRPISAGVHRRKAREPEPVAEPRPALEPREPFDPSIHTFDWKSGRRILIVDAQKPTARHESMGIVKEMDEFKDHNLAKGDKDKEHGDSAHLGPTKPEWPGARTERSVRDYLKRSKIDRLGPDQPPPGTLPPARMLPAYQNIQDNDMVISVEHCVNCKYHNTTLRHDENQYCAEADNLLRAISAAIHEYNPCIRLGVFRFGANITPKHRDSDINSRIGAFEVQIAFRDMFGDVSKEMLHSKLSSRRWPSKSVTLKRLSTFLSKVKIMKHRPPGDDDKYEKDRDSLGFTPYYPIGLGHWMELEIASPAWVYVNTNTSSEPSNPSPSRSSKVKGKSAANTGTVDVVVSTEDVSVEWLFDSRHCQDQPLFNNGEKVWVSKYGAERYPMLGTVVKADGKNASMEKVVTLQLQYMDTTTVVCEDHCQNFSEHHPDIPANDENGVPTELRVLFHHSRNLMRWQANNDDKVIKEGAVTYHLLSRKSIFQQVRELVLVTEKSKRSRGTYLVPSDRTGDPDVDLQKCYTEPILDWICGQSPDSNGLINIESLVARVLPVPVPRLNVKSPEKDNKEHAVPHSQQYKLDEVAKSDVSAESRVLSKDSEKAPSELSSNRKESPRPESNEKSLTPVIGKEVVSSKDLIPDNIVADSVRAFVQQLLKWCEAEGCSDGDKLSHLRSLFLKDENETGELRSLDLIQFCLAIEKFGLNCTTDIVQGLLAAFDDDGNGLLQYEELLGFLKDDNPNKFALGDIWSKLRGLLINDVSGVKHHRVGELDEALHSKCNSDFDQITEIDFLQTLKKINVHDVLSSSELMLLTSRFSVTPAGEFEGHYIDVGRFMAWLNPVDIARASKRLTKSIENYGGRQQKPMSVTEVLNDITSKLLGVNESSNSIDAIDLNKEKYVKDFLETMYSFQVPVSRAEGRAFSKFFGHKRGDLLRISECIAILQGHLVVVSTSDNDSIEKKTALESEAFESYTDSNDVGEKMKVTSGAFDYSLSSSFDASKVDQNADSFSDTPQSKFSALDMCIDLLELKGEPLKQKLFDRVYVTLTCGNFKVKTTVNASGQKGTDARLLDVKDGNQVLHLQISKQPPSMVIDLYSYVDQESPDIPPACGQVVFPLNDAIKSYKSKTENETGSSKITFEISTKLGTISGLLHAHFVEAKSSVASRIRKMSSQDLFEVKFKPLSQEFDDENEESSSHLPLAFSFGLSSLDNA